MITGFFYSETVAHRRELKQIGKILTITIGANLFYLIWKVLLALKDENNIKDALLARFEERMPEDFILWNFSPLSPHLWYLQALVYVLVIAFIVEHLGLKEACISGNSGTVGRKPDKGKLFSVSFWEKIIAMFIMREIFCIVACPFSGWAAWFGARKEALGGLSRQKENDIALLGGTSWFSGTWHVMEQKMACEKRNALGTQEEYGGTIFLAICIFLLFIGWQNFYVENVGNPDNWQKSGKDYSMLIYVLALCGAAGACPECFKGRRSLLAKRIQTVWDDVCVCGYCGDGGSLR